MRAAVYLDQAFWSKDGEVYAARSFVLFLGKLAEHFDELTVAARLSPEPSSSHYRLPPPARFAPLPHYGSAARPLTVIRAARSRRPASANCWTRSTWSGCSDRIRSPCSSPGWRRAAASGSCSACVRTCPVTSATAVRVAST